MKRLFSLWIVWVCLIFFVVEAKAQILDNSWSIPYPISTKDSLPSDGSIVSDSYGFSHVLWTEVDAKSGRTAIKYLLFDGKNWLGPTDIYTTNPDVPIDSISPAVDSSGILHLIWTEGGIFRQRQVFYMNVPADKAFSVKLWSSPSRLEIVASLIKIQVDSRGTAHIIFAKFYKPLSGIYHIYSVDQGVTWSEEQWLDPDIPVDSYPATIQFVCDESNRLHVLWDYSSFSSIETWIRYSKSVDGGISWSQPFTIDIASEESERLSAAGPRLAVSGRAIHAIWGSSLKRLHRFSLDSGDSWGIATPILGQLEGQAGDGLAVDGAGRVHYLAQLRYPQGIYHTYWEQDHWVGPALIYLIANQFDELRGDRIHAHLINVAFLNGNHLVMTLTDPPANPDHKLYVTHRLLDDINASPTQPIPHQVLPPPGETSVPNSTPTASLVLPSEQAPYQDPTSTSDKLPVNIDQSNPNSAGNSNPGTIFLLAGFIPAALVIGLVFLYRIIKTKWNLSHR